MSLKRPVCTSVGGVVPIGASIALVPGEDTARPSLTGSPAVSSPTPAKGSGVSEFGVVMGAWLGQPWILQ
ncbi:hypothetical protein FIBSPDRAFT_876831 [Athelia psychrophila]|uniref:Uncharacterized protein n=1 Tax=Athelia psychrophila TaxID=1759441 RepID=A0A167WGW2_9AGAM|nr:hypothetical protein FIBSPDRAFT_876831 [Fibularhizoctonia sp. CBS 109695]